MTENQKLREALQAISHIDDTTNHSVDASAALDRIGQIARQALALPTAAPVGERLTLSAEDVHTAFVKHFPKTRISQAWIGFAAEIAEAIAARSALSAGDAVLAEREACAKLCEEVADDLITAMREEGETDDEVMTSLVASSRVCAKEIRGGYSKKFNPHNAAIDAAMRKGKP